MQSQASKILEYMTQNPIDPMTALRKFGCFRLAARINDLRNEGHKIITTKKNLPNGKFVAEYRLLKRAYD